MKTELTEKEKELMIEVRDYWNNLFDSLAFDEEKAKELINYIYEISGFRKPLILILDSPLTVQIVANIFRGNILEGVGKYVDRNIWDNIESKFRGEIIENILNKVWADVERDVGEDIKRNVLEKIMVNVRANVGRNIWVNVRANINRNIKEKMNIQYYNEGWYGRCDDFGWISFYDFFERIGIVKNQEFEKFRELVKCGIFSSLQFEKICFVSKPPIFLNRDENRKMHCTTGMAIQFADGYGPHYVHGVYFSPEDFEKYVKDKKATGKEIISVKNAEQRACLMKYYGFDYILNDLPNLVILERKKQIINNKEREYILYEFDIDSERKLRWRLLREPDFSTDRDFFISLSANREQTKTIQGALAWSYGFEKPEEYSPEIET
jgi:hypothetical protein